MHRDTHRECGIATEKVHVVGKSSTEGKGEGGDAIAGRRGRERESIERGRVGVMEREA